LGAFQGTYTISIGIPAPLPISGNIDMFLAESQNGEFFEVTDGQLAGIANTPIGPAPFSARIEGTLDCTTLRFDAQLLDGGYDYFGQKGAFSGPLTSGYDSTTSRLAGGTWQVSEPADPSRGGNGTWDATFTP
ncbi:MAG: hypothetical protein FJ104_15775, partial [Deltaproteobacteria bacterium]|nr:hypothetical protein [Deltaproteobacteria bacterium]